MLLVGLADPALFVYLIISFLISFTLHEAAHALAATVLGDNTARELGRLTLNPIKHLEKWGTLLMLTVGLGWGKPVPIDPMRFKGVSPKVGMGIVGIAGPVTNIILALLIAIPLQLKLFPFTAERMGPLLISWGEFAALFFYLNIALAAFNMIPFGPLDGSRVLNAFLPERWFYFSAKLEIPLLIFFFGVILLDRFLQLGILSNIIQPIACEAWWAFIHYSPPNMLACASL
ncbi:MAG: site-2 protease family protein [Anaerolineales bacterium]|nr:site-2 protease family protein [Anaerolineales bacterium]MCB9127312.1 site-2 protease family protein [Ardenticatenales bacterium]